MPLCSRSRRGGPEEQTPRALREQFADTGIAITCPMPGANETEVFGRADMMDTKAGSTRVRAFMTNVLPDTTLAKLHAKQAATGRR